MRRILFVLALIAVLGLALLIVSRPVVGTQPGSLPCPLSVRVVSAAHELIEEDGVIKMIDASNRCAKGNRSSRE